MPASNGEQAIDMNENSTGGGGGAPESPAEVVQVNNYQGSYRADLDPARACFQIFPRVS